ncbi:hypothetical protein BDU57DRAFT_515012 [Ampelomyces quisqualis]|uniref:DUF1993 domain-containing protein n=1 Tax=Ampelomyces quisqualis TaxID=50730 RepID=A0A6A5QU29_AMPQU|nr:hypothetical protein BDU57DRAFT_515012 [Ampelomyces quisqualis]
MSSISFHHLSLSPVLLGLRNAMHILQKGQSYASSSPNSPSSLLEARLHPDMANLIFQVQRFTDAAKFIPPRVNPSNPSITLEDNETSFEELIARVEKTIAYLEGIEEKSFEGREGEDIVMKTGGREMKFGAVEYVLTVAQPNFWFHVTTMYGILRMKGVDVGKADFLRGKEGFPKA